MNENQRIVLEELKKEYEGTFPLDAVDEFFEHSTSQTWKIYKSLTEKEEFQILIEFGKWGLKQ